jgi:RNA polymerase sigma-70 factor (ECF subfamily)
MRTESLSLLHTLDLTSVESNDLVRRVQGGCAFSATELSNRYMPRLLILLERRVRGSRADAEDVAQDSMVKAFQELDRFDFQYRFSTWLYTIAIRRAIDFNRKVKRRIPADSDASLDQIPARLVSNGEELSQRVDNVWRVARAVLVESQYSVLWLKYGEALSVAEIAAVLSKSQIVIRVQLHRARAKLTKELKRKDREYLPQSESGNPTS